MANHKFIRNQQGLTLIEMMVAMTLGIILLGGMGTVMLSSKSTYRINEAMSQVQENARYAFQLLSRDIRMAGYRGCVGDNASTDNVLSKATEFLWKLDQSLEGFEATNASVWDPALPSGITSPLGARDVIVIRGIEGANIRVISHVSESADLIVAADSGIETGNTVLVSNCQGSTIFQVTGVSDASGQKIIEHAGGTGEPNVTTALGRQFTGGEMVQISTRSYYIRTNPRGIPSLYSRRGEAPAEELVEGIENMQIQYGEDTNEDRTIDTYRAASEVTNWNAVVSVRINLLAQSVTDGVTSQAQPYFFNGENITPADRRLRQVFSTVISLRNRAS